MNCNSCGGDLLASEKVCKYCGAANPNYVAPSPYSETRTSGPRADYTYRQPSSAPAKTPFKWVTFIILLIVFWPVAIIYALSKLGNN